jgi:hypothetical protein
MNLHTVIAFQPVKPEHLFGRSVGHRSLPDGSPPRFSRSSLAHPGSAPKASLLIRACGAMCRLGREAVTCPWGVRKRDRRQRTGSFSIGLVRGTASPYITTTRFQAQLAEGSPKTTWQFILGAELSAAMALNGCASTSISFKDEVQVRFRAAEPLRCDHIEPTDTQSTRARRSLARPWFKYKPWLSKSFSTRTR